MSEEKQFDGDGPFKDQSSDIQACIVMAAPQFVVIGLLIHWGQPVHGLIVAALLLAQGVLMIRLLDDPRGRAAWYNATGTSLYVLGMLACAFALRAFAGAGA